MLAGNGNFSRQNYKRMHLHDEKQAVNCERVKSRYSLPNHFYFSKYVMEKETAALLSQKRTIREVCAIKDDDVPGHCIVFALESGLPHLSLKFTVAIVAFLGSIFGHIHISEERSSF